MTMEQAVEQGALTIEGDISKVKELLGASIEFDAFFNVVTD